LSAQTPTLALAPSARQRAKVFFQADDGVHGPELWMACAP
jgi:hypothetical protein